MSMIGELRSISPALLEAIKKDPALVQTVVLSETIELQDAISRQQTTETHEAGVDLPGLSLPPAVRQVVESLPQTERDKFLKMYTEGYRQIMHEFKKHPLVSPFMNQQREVATSRADLDAAGFNKDDIGPAISIEKAWHGVHFLLCGTAGEAPPPLGNTILGGREIGPDLAYGPARYLSPEAVRQVSEALAGITQEELKSRYIPAKMADIYPSVWDDEAEVEWLLDAFQQVRDYYSDASTRGRAMLLYIT